jgi:PAS domain S-box-containing protein
MNAAGSLPAIIGTTLEGVVQTWNPAAEALFGYSEREMIGSSIMLIVPSDQMTAEVWLLDQAARGRDIGTVETVRRHRNGMPVEIELSASPAFDAARRPVGVTMVCRDIGREKVARAARLASDRAVWAPLNTAEAILHVALDGQIVRVSERFCLLTGWSRETLLTRTIQEITCVEDRALDSLALGDLALGRVSSFTTRQRLFRRTGEAADFDLAFSARAHVDGVPNYLEVRAEPAAGRVLQPGHAKAGA